MASLRPTVVARIKHEIEYGYRKLGEAGYHLLRNEDKLALAMCHHYRQISFRCMPDALKVQGASSGWSEHVAGGANAQ
eukprot:2261794-Karenia_brevis.AAC.1